MFQSESKHSERSEIPNEQYVMYLWSVPKQWWEVGSLQLSSLESQFSHRSHPDLLAEPQTAEALQEKQRQILIHGIISGWIYYTMGTGHQVILPYLK